MHNELVRLLNNNVTGANAKINQAADAKSDSSVTVDAESIHAVAKYLRTNAEMPFNALQCVSGVDYMDRMEVCYMLANFDVTAPREVILKVVLTDRVNPTVDSIVDIYAAANFQERECYDMFGVTFKNHPDHRRILCPDDWEGFPLRKDYVYPKTYNGMDVFPDNKMNFEDREFIVRQDMIKKAQEASSTKQ